MAWRTVSVSLTMMEYLSLAPISRLRQDSLSHVNHPLLYYPCRLSRSLQHRHQVHRDKKTVSLSDEFTLVTNPISNSAKIDTAILAPDYVLSSHNNGLQLRPTCPICCTSVNKVLIFFSVSWFLFSPKLFCLKYIYFNIHVKTITFQSNVILYFKMGRSSSSSELYRVAKHRTAMHFNSRQSNSSPSKFRKLKFSLLCWVLSAYHLLSYYCLTLCISLLFTAVVLSWVCYAPQTFPNLLLCLAMKLIKFTTLYNWSVYLNTLNVKIHAYLRPKIHVFIYTCSCPSLLHWHFTFHDDTAL